MLDRCQSENVVQIVTIDVGKRRDKPIRHKRARLTMEWIPDSLRNVMEWCQKVLPFIYC
jgi:hypothetical protein